MCQKASVYHRAVNQEEAAYLAKAFESLAGAESELAAGRYNNAANRAYYAAFQAAIHALSTEGERRDIWGHDFVQAQFSAQFINRRKVYPAELRDVLSRLAIIRGTADYALAGIGRTQANRAVQLAKRFVEVVGKVK